MKTISIAASVLTMVLSLAAKAGELKSDREAVNKACTADSATAGCGSEKVGTGLLKCLHAYKKSHKEFKFSDGCKTAMKELREDRKEVKK